MFSIKHRVFLGLALLLAAVQAWGAPMYTFAGSWVVGDGPDNALNPPVYSGREAAALLFGGDALDYVISTIDEDAENINFRAFLDGYGDETFLIEPAPDTFSLSSNGGGYANDPSFSAYVLDHTCFNRYVDPSQACAGDGTQFVNYAFRVADVQEVPEPATGLLLLVALAGCAAARGRAAANGRR